jgi:diguanylate cyclase (GGDEF)-like protein
MSAALRRWVRQIEHRIVERQDSTSCLVFVDMALPILLVLWGMQWLAGHDPAAKALYRADLMGPSLWAQGMLMAWLLCMGLVAWRRRLDAAAMPVLVQLTLIPGVTGIMLLALAYGLKDTPMSMMLLAVLVFARALFSWRQLRWAFWMCLAAFVISEVLTAINWMLYAPLLTAPVYTGGAMDAWWAVWMRVMFAVVVLPFSWVLFFVAASMSRHRAALETLVRTDMLTGLLNRREFMTRLEREAHRQARGGRLLSIVMFDVDHFKQINDQWGHPKGDEVLAAIGHLLRSQTREQVDTAARYGGEEFVLILPETDLAGALNVAEKLSVRLREMSFFAKGQSFKVTQSAGIAQVVEGNVDWALKVADRHLYEAKNAGRDRMVGSVAFPPGPDEPGHARLNSSEGLA